MKILQVYVSEDLHTEVRERVREKKFTSMCEYMRALIRKDLRGE